VTQRSHRLMGLGVLLGALVGSNALADPSSDTKPGKATGHAGSHSSALSGHAGGHSDAKAQRAEAKSDRPGSMPGDRGAEGKSGKNSDMPQSADGKPMPGGNSDHEKRGLGMGRGGFRSEMRAIREGIKDGSIKKEDIKSRLEKLRETQSERRKQHQQLVHQRWGSSLLATSQAKQELKEHARRSAMLDRALLLAQTETKLPDRNKVIERIEKLIEREDARHERVMTQMKSTPGSAEAKAAPPQPPTPSEKPMQGGDR
jgi:hypothetical protein